MWFNYINMMNEYLDYFFGPLPAVYCNVFYGLSVLMALCFVIILVKLVTLLMSSDKSKKGLPGVYTFLLITYFVYYFIFRLLNTMCVNAL